MIRRVLGIIRRLAQRELPSHDQLTVNELMAKAYQPLEGSVDEVWRPVPGWEGLYEVSDHGRVRSLDRICSRPGPKGDCKVKGILLRPERPGGSKKFRNKLQRFGSSQYYCIDFLVMSAFVGPCPEGFEIVHCDGNIENDRLANLRYAKTASKEEVKLKLDAEKRRIEKVKAFKREINTFLRGMPGYIPSKDELEANFVYKNGKLYWKSDRNAQIKAGNLAGSISVHGYVVVSLKGRSYLAHRLIWVMHGNDPAETVDHINRDRSDNRIENLRSASKGQQLLNTGLRSDNKSGIKGVSWHKPTGTWRGQVWHQGKAYSAGYFHLKEECADAVKALRERLHGEFARHAFVA